LRLRCAVSQPYPSRASRSTRVLYAGALSWTALDYRLALLAVIASLGLVKLLASKHWAFATA
jgi:hypothetical protein